MLLLCNRKFRFRKISAVFFRFPLRKWTEYAIIMMYCYAIEITHFKNNGNYESSKENQDI